MAKGKSGGKATKERLFRQMNAKKKVRDTKRAMDAANQPVTRGELYAIQHTLNIRTDKALMGVAAVVQILVEKKLCMYEDFKDNETEMTDILKFIRIALAESEKELGAGAKSEDQGTFVYEKAIAFGVDKDILENIFGVRPSKSRIIKPNQAKLIVTK
jgi:hypothetical protein